MKRQYSQNNKDSGADMIHMTATVIAISKKLGYSFDELNDMTTQAFFDVLHAHAGESESEQEKTPRWASGKDADTYFN